MSESIDYKEEINDMIKEWPVEFEDKLCFSFEDIFLGLLNKLKLKTLDIAIIRGDSHEQWNKVWSETILYYINRLSEQ